MLTCRGAVARPSAPTRQSHKFAALQVTRCCALSIGSNRADHAERSIDMRFSSDSNMRPSNADLSFGKLDAKPDQREQRRLFVKTATETTAASRASSRSLDPSIALRDAHRSRPHDRCRPDEATVHRRATMPLRCVYEGRGLDRIHQSHALFDIEHRDVRLPAPSI